MSKNKPSKGQLELDEYKFDREDIASMLGKSTNAVRMMMRRSNCKLEYRFDGKKFWFKRPRDNPVERPPKTSHEKTLRDYDRKVQQRYNRGSTHKEHGGEVPYKGKYDQQSFKHHNELKLMNSLQGKYKNDAQRREFENMNEEALKEADKRGKAKAEASNTYHGRPKYGGMVYGQYNSLNWKQWDRPYDLDSRPPPSSSFHIGGKPFVGYGNYEQEGEKKEEITYTWDEPKVKDPGDGYRPGRFKHLDEAIRNTRKK